LCGSFCCVALHHFFFFVASHHFFDQELDGAFAYFGCAYFGAWGEDTEFGVRGDLFYQFDWFRPCVAVGGGFGEVEAGDLEAVEEEAGAARVDLVGGDALEDFADGGLDGGAVFGQRQVEGGRAAAAPARVGDGFAGGLVVVAELFLTEAGAGAAVPSVKMWRHRYCFGVSMVCGMCVPPHGVLYCAKFWEDKG
jgi:hypothetical protein